MYRFWGIAGRTRLITHIIVSLAVAFLTSSVVWVPFARFYLETARSIPVDLSNIPGWLLPVQHLVQFIAPDFLEIRRHLIIGAYGIMVNS